MPEPPQPRRKLKVDMEGSALALDNASGSVSYYLGLETGEVVQVMGKVRATLNDIYQELAQTTGEDEDEFNRKFDEVMVRLGLPDWLKQAVKEADQVESDLSALRAGARGGLAGMISGHGGLHRHRGQQAPGRVAQRGH
jgi:RecJ-like exonuclease